MPAADTRENANPTPEDIAFARTRKRRMLGPEDGETVADIGQTAPTGGDTSTEMAQLRAELAELRKMIAQNGGKAPTSARRIGDVADAEMAAEKANEDLAQLADPEGLTSGLKLDQLEPKKGGSAKDLAAAVARLKKATEQVDIARCLAGEIPKTHPGLRHLSPDHPAFRIR